MFNQRSANDSQVTTIFVYGYSSAKTPFYEEAPTKKLDGDRWSLLLNAAVSRGQKLLLMEAANPNSLQGEIVNLRPLTGQMFEVEVAVAR